MLGTLPKAEYEHEPTIELRAGLTELVFEQLHLCDRCGADRPVITMNQEALARLRVGKRLVIVSGATHLFEEPGALEEVARLALQWFDHHLTCAGERAPQLTQPNDQAAAGQP